MTPIPIRLTEAHIRPYASCLGDDPDPDAKSNCSKSWPMPGPTVLASVKEHIRQKPTHQVLVVRETRTLYGMP